ncbi:MAG: hypothetical protein IJ405_03665 [Lachnospiraceae bacterium]|nr:hypothetical protein [Lachnospiraceae bacterium]
MADIRSYTKEKEKREQNKAARQGKLKLVKSESEENFQQKLRKHRLSYVYRIGLLLLVCVVIVAIIAIQYNNKTYEDYDVIDTTGKAAVNGTTDIALGKYILTYSKDGAHCTDSAGNVLWDQTYEMQSPIVSICGDVVAIGDYNGRTIYVQSAEKQLGTINTNLPIRNLCVAGNGVVAAVLEDTEETWIRIYDASGKELLYFRTTMKNTGYPISVSLSPDALLCTISYIYVDAGKVKSSVAFYNFGEYGQNQIDNLVGGYDYPDTLVSYVQYMNNSTVFAVGDDSVMFFKVSQKPDAPQIYYFDEEVRGVYYNEEYVGLVFYNEASEKRYRLDIYNAAGNLIESKEFDMDYADIVFDKDTYIIYNEKECIITTMDGVEKYNGIFKKQVRLLVPTSGKYRYTLVTDDTIDVILMR